MQRYNDGGFVPRPQGHFGGGIWGSPARSDLAVATTAALAATTAQARGTPDDDSWFMDLNRSALCIKNRAGEVCCGTECFGPNRKLLKIWDEDEDEKVEQVQKIDWNKVVNIVSSGLDIYGKIQQLFDEEEGSYWEIGGGASSGPNGQTNWNINGKIGGTFDEEEEQEEQIQKLQFDLRKAQHILHTANQLGLFDEDNDLDQVQKLKLGKLVKNAVKVVKVAGAVGLLEEGVYIDSSGEIRADNGHYDFMPDLSKPYPSSSSQGGGTWGLGAGYSSTGVWHVDGSLGWTWDEDEELPPPQKQQKQQKQHINKKEHKRHKQHNQQQQQKQQKQQQQHGDHRKPLLQRKLRK